MNGARVPRRCDAALRHHHRAALIRQRLAARSIKICGTEADSSFFFRSRRMLRSSVSSLPNSFLFAYHFDRQSWLTARRRPIGLVFWPILYSSDKTILM